MGRFRSLDQYLVGDALPGGDPAERHVRFRDTAKGVDVPIVSRMPALEGDANRRHIHCRARFCLHDALICYTTLVLGRVGVAFVRGSDLIARLP